MDQLRYSRYGSDVKFWLSRPFEDGIQSLQDFRDGILPRTFEDIFALMHIVHAIHAQTDDPLLWRTFSLDVLLWQHAIATQDERILFLDVAFTLWVPDSSMDEAKEHFNAFLLQQPGWSLPESRDVSGDPSSFYFNFYQQSTTQALNSSTAPFSMGRIDFGAPNPVWLYNKLKEGQAISLCMRYLDGKLLLSTVINLSCLELKVHRSCT